MKSVVLIKSATGQYTEVNFGNGPEEKYDEATYGSGIYLCTDTPHIYIMGAKKNLVNKVEFLGNELEPNEEGNIVIPMQMVDELPGSPDENTVYLIKSPTASN